MPSLPGLPLFSLTRLSAARQFWRSTTSSIRPPMPERPSPRPASAASTRAAGPAASPPALAARPNGFGFCGMASPRDEVVSPFSSFGPSPGQARRRSRLALLLVRSFAGASPETKSSRPSPRSVLRRGKPGDEVVSPFSSFGPSPGQARRRSRLALLLVRSFAGASPETKSSRPSPRSVLRRGKPGDEVVSPFSSFGPSPGQARRRSRLALLLVRSFAGASPATMTSADFSPPRYAASPFQAQDEISPGKSLGLRGAAAGSTPPCLGHESFAITCSLALRSDAFYPVPVRRPAASRPASFTLASRSNALRFASLAVSSSREDLHIKVDAHAGRTGRIASPAARNDGWD